MWHGPNSHSAIVSIKFLIVASRIADNAESRVQEFWVADSAALVDQATENAVNRVAGQYVASYAVSYRRGKSTGSRGSSD